MPELADFNPQKAAFTHYVATFAAATSNPKSLERAARFLDYIVIAPQFGAAIENVFAPEDAEHLHRLGMAELALQAVQWLRASPSEKNAPEWLRHTGVDFARILAA